MIDSIMTQPPSGSMSMDAWGGGGGPGRLLAGPGRTVIAGIRGSGCRIDAACGVDQEGALRGALLAGGDSLQHGKPVAEAGTEDDFAALIDARLGLDIDDLARAGVDDRRLGDAQDLIPRPRCQPGQVLRGLGLELVRATAAADPDFP